MQSDSKSPNGVMDAIEETLIALILGTMTVVTFANVVARYFFNSNILWALELTVFCFAWLVLLGASYAVKHKLHLGVDVFIEWAPQPVRKAMALFSAFICLIFGLLLLKGSWDYWANFANLPGTEGRWFPLGFEESYRGKGWYEVFDIPMPEALRWMEDVFNEGEEYEKIPRLIPYAVLPLSMALFLWRVIQSIVSIWRGIDDRLIASHEVEEDLAEASAKNRDPA